MALVKHSNAHKIARDAIVLDLGDLQRQGDQIMAIAKANATQTIEAGRKERERLISTAEIEGKKAGMEAGRAEGRKLGQTEGRAEALKDRAEKLAKLDAAWVQALDQFRSQRDDMLADAGRDVLRLAVLIAERITKRTIELNPRTVIDQMAAVLAVIVRPTELVVRVNPGDREVLAAALPVLTERFSQAQHIELVDDPALGPGSCIADTRSRAAPGSAPSLLPGQIDASIATQLDRIVEALLPGESRAGNESSGS